LWVPIRNIGVIHTARPLDRFPLRFQVEPQGSQGTQTRGTWDVCITEGCSSIKNQTICIGSVKDITGAFFLEGVLYIKLTSHVPISVSTRMTFAWHQQWSGRSGPCLVYRRDGYRFAIFICIYVIYTCIYIWIYISNVYIHQNVCI